MHPFNALANDAALAAEADTAFAIANAPVDADVERPVAVGRPARFVERAVAERAERNLAHRAPAFSLSSEMRLIVEEWKRISSGLKESVVFYPDAVEAGDHSSDAPKWTALPPMEAPRWPSPLGSDVFMQLEIQKANRLLEKGPRTYSYVCQVADRLAFSIVARSFGIETTTRALQAGRGLMRSTPAPAVGLSGA